MPTCNVLGCIGMVNLHKFPNKTFDKTRYDAWITATGDDDVRRLKDPRICDNHFEISAYSEISVMKVKLLPHDRTVKKRLKKSAIPTVQLGPLLLSSDSEHTVSEPSSDNNWDFSECDLLMSQDSASDLPMSQDMSMTEQPMSNKSQEITQGIVEKTAPYTTVPK